MRRLHGLHSDGKGGWIKRTPSRLPRFPRVLVTIFACASQRGSEQLESDSFSKSARAPLAIDKFEESPGDSVPAAFLTEAAEVLACHGHRHKVDHFEEHHDVLVGLALKDSLEVVIEE